MMTTYAIACLVFGLVALLIGALLRILHWPGAVWFQVPGVLLGLVGVLLVGLVFIRRSGKGSPRS